MQLVSNSNHDNNACFSWRRMTSLESRSQQAYVVPHIYKQLKILFCGLRDLIFISIETWCSFQRNGEQQPHDVFICGVYISRYSRYVEFYVSSWVPRVHTKRGWFIVIYIRFSSSFKGFWIHIKQKGKYMWLLKHPILDPSVWFCI